MKRHPTELLGAYSDGELDARDTAAVAEHLQVCTECARELALLRSIGGAMRTMVAGAEPRDAWSGVHRRITRPTGWLLVIAGIASWCAMVLLEWWRERELTWEWMTASAIGIGIALLLASVLHEQYAEWKNSRYRDVER